MRITGKTLCIKPENPMQIAAPIKKRISGNSAALRAGRSLGRGAISRPVRRSAMHWRKDISFTPLPGYLN
jgi:hypothetical protein